MSEKFDPLDLLTSFPLAGKIAPLATPVPAIKPPELVKEHVSLSALQAARDRFDKRLARLNELLPIRNGRSIPNEEDMLLGDAKRLTVGVLFLDICGFSKMESGEDDSQDQVFKIVNLFISEMLYLLRTMKGYFEKNTGDGLMAYFQGGDETELAARCVEAAVSMHCLNDQVLAPKMETLGLPKMQFRVGIETGRIIVAKVGVRGGEHDSLVAIGNAANVACKLMTLIPDGGIVVGAHTKALLPAAWQPHMHQLPTPLPNFVFRDSDRPYTAFEISYRVPPKPAWMSALLPSLGGM